MKTKSIFGVLGLMLIGIVAASGIAAAFGFGNQAARDAVAAGDFSAWKEAKMAELTEENFAKIQERFQSRQQHQQDMEQQRQEMDQAMAQGFDAWSDFIKDTPRGDKLLEVINADNFDRFVAMHDAMENGDFDTAKSIAEELGIQGPFGRGRGAGCKFA